MKISLYSNSEEIGQFIPPALVFSPLSSFFRGRVLTMQSSRTFLQLFCLPIVLVVSWTSGPSWRSIARSHPAGSTIARRSGTEVSALDNDSASVLFVVPSLPVASPFGATSPLPHPDWARVISHISERLSFFDRRIQARTILIDEVGEPMPKADIVVAVGLYTPGAAATLSSPAAGVRSTSAFLAADCSSEVMDLQFVGKFKPWGIASALAAAAPWTESGQGKRLLRQAATLFQRNSSEDFMYALFFVLHARVLELDVVRYTVNPTWEKGALGNAREFKKMFDCCGDKILAAVSDPETKKAIDLLNDVDLRDQVGSYRVIVSYETELLEAFSLCILQQHNCFNCDAKILDKPGGFPVLREWRGEPLTQAAARQIFVGHLDHVKYRHRAPSGDNDGGGCDDNGEGSEMAAASLDDPRGDLPWSWKVSDSLSLKGLSHLVLYLPSYPPVCLTGELINELTD